MSETEVRIVEVNNLTLRKEFVKFQFRLYKNCSLWVPPMIRSEISSLDSKINPAFKVCKAHFWLAVFGKETVGRIGGIIIEPLNKKNGSKRARFTRPEFIDNIEVAKLLFNTVENWAKEQGMNDIDGPLGFSNLDHQGLLIEGFEHLPSAASDYHLPYYAKHYERNGYKKLTDWVEFKLNFPEEMPKKAGKLSEIVLERYNLSVKNFKKKKELLPYKKRLHIIFNNAFSMLFGTYPLEKEHFEFYVSKFWSVIKVNWVKIIETEEGEIAGFIVALPSLSLAMQKANGKIIPFGWFYLKKALKKPEVMDLVLTGVLPEYQHMGLASVLIQELYTSAKSYPVKYIESTAMLEENKLATQTWKNFTFIQHKRKRCYTKRIQ